jgi:hypothetical protein
MGKAAVPLKMSAVVSRDMSVGLIGGRKGSQKRIRIFGGSGFKAEEGKTAAPTGVVETRLQPGSAEICATGVVPFPGVGEGQKRNNSRSDVSDGSRAAVRNLIGRARGRSEEIRQRIAAAGTAALGDIGLLRSVVDNVDGIERGVREEDDADVGIEFEIEMIGPLRRIAIGCERCKSSWRDKTESGD